MALIFSCGEKKKLLCKFVMKSHFLLRSGSKQFCNVNSLLSFFSGIGGDPFNGTNFMDCLDIFLKDPETEGKL